MRIWQIIVEVADGEAEHDDFSMRDLLDALKKQVEEEDSKASTVEMREVRIKAAA